MYTKVCPQLCYHMKALYRSHLLWHVPFCCLLIIVLAKCITPYEPRGVASSEGILVVEAYIIAPTGSSIKLSRTNSLQDDMPPQKISNAQINVIDDSGNIIATANEDSKGEYLINSPISFLPGVKYALDIVTGDDHLRSTFEEPLITPEIQDVRWDYKIDEREVDILLSTFDPLQKTEYYLWRYEEDWEYTPQLYAESRWDPQRYSIVQNTPDNNVYYCWDKDHSKSFILGDIKTLQDGVLKDKLIVNLRSGDTRFSLLYSILIKQYSISHDTYKYFESLHMNTSETGGLFAPMPTWMEGNITNLSNPYESVVGYALISTETIKRIYIRRGDVPLMSIPTNYECFLEPPGDIIKLLTTAGRAYELGWGMFDGEYRPLKCVDCLKLGGSKNKPDFWPTSDM